MENISFRKLLSLIIQKGNFNETLPRLQQEYIIKLYKITELNSKRVDDLYQNMQKKFYINRKKESQQFWYENQLRIFIWLLFGYLYVYEKSINDLNDDDWIFFSIIFNYKSLVFFQFQVLSIIKSKIRPSNWSEQETQLLSSIMNQSTTKNRWNYIARQLFLKSGKRFFRNPKQCRERWMNHLDPNKVRTQWTLSEDLVLMNVIKKKGKKWSLAVKELKHTRTEHMVKNRYKSLIANQIKKHPDKRESEIENLLIKRITKLSDKNQKNDIIQQQENVLNTKKDDLYLKVGKSPEYKRQENDKKREKDVKVQNEDSFEPFIENFPVYEEEICMKSPLFIPWKQSPHNENLNQQISFYDFSESQNSSFFRF